MLTLPVCRDGRILSRRRIGQGVRQPSFEVACAASPFAHAHLEPRSHSVRRIVQTLVCQTLPDTQVQCARMVAWHSTTTKTFRFVIEGEEMRNVYTFAGLTFALAPAFRPLPRRHQVRSPNKKPHQISARQTPLEIGIGTGLVNAWSGSVGPEPNGGSKETIEADSGWRV